LVKAIIRFGEFRLVFLVRQSFVGFAPIFNRESNCKSSVLYLAGVLASRENDNTPALGNQLADQDIPGIFMTARREFGEDLLPDLDESSINSVGVASTLCLEERPVFPVSVSFPRQHEASPSIDAERLIRQ